MKKIALVLVLVFLFPFLSSASNTTEEEKGICHFKFVYTDVRENGFEEKGCSKKASINDCKEFVERVGAKFIDFEISDVPSKQLACKRTKASDLALDRAIQSYSMKETRLRIRLVLNTEFWNDYFFEYKNLYSDFAIILGTGLIIFVCLFFYNRVVYIPRIGFVIIPLLFTDFLFSVMDIDSPITYYININGVAYSIAALYNTFTVSVSLLLIVFALLYNYIQFRRGIIPKSMARFINFIDEIKSKLTPE